MSNLTLTEAFAEYGAKLANPQWAVSDMTENGMLVVSCWAHYFKKVNNVLRYEDTLSRWRGNIAGNKLFGEHLGDALKNDCAVRLVIVRTEETAVVDSGEAATKVKKEFYTRPEMIGRVTYFDGDRYIIEFKRSIG